VVKWEFQNVLSVSRLLNQTLKSIPRSLQKHKLLQVKSYTFFNDQLYVSNNTLNSDLNLPIVTELSKLHYNRFNNKLNHNPNSFIIQLKKKMHRSSTFGHVKNGQILECKSLTIDPKKVCHPCLMVYTLQI